MEPTLIFLPGLGADHRGTHDLFVQGHPVDADGIIRKFACEHFLSNG